MNATEIPSIVHSSIIGMIRKNLPVDGRSDAELGLILNFSLLCVALFAHIIARIVSDKKDDTSFERRVVHNVATECKKLEATISKKEKELKQLNEEIHELEARVEAVEGENRVSQNKISEAEKKFQEEQKIGIDMEKAKNSVIDELSNLKCALEKVEEQLKKNEDERALLAENLTEAQKNNIKLESEVKDGRAEKEKLQLQLEHAKETLLQKDKEKKDLEDQIAGLTVLLDEPEQIRKPKSNASDGWSDCEEDVAAKPVTSKTLKPVELRELSKLRKQLIKLEKEHDITTHNLERSAEDKQRLETEILSLKKEMEIKTKELEIRDADRRGSDERATQLLNLIQESSTKINEKESDIKSLGEQVHKFQIEINVLKDQLHAKENKIRDSDVETKKWRNDYLRLETTSYSKEQELVRTIQSLQAFMQPPASFNTSQNSSFYKDNGSFRLDEQSSLWDHPDTEPTMIRTHSSPEDDILPRPPKSIRNSRCSNPLMADYSSGNESRKDIDVTYSRRRSRSHGRQNGSIMGPDNFFPSRRL